MRGDLKNDYGVQRRVREAAEALVKASSLQVRILGAGLMLTDLTADDFPAEIRPTWHEVHYRLQPVELGPDAALVSDEDGEVLALAILKLSHVVEVYLASH